MKQLLVTIMIMLLPTTMASARTSFEGEVHVMGEHFGDRTSDESGLYGEVNLELEFEDDGDSPFLLYLNPRLRRDSRNLYDEGFQSSSDRRGPALFLDEGYFQLEGETFLVGAGYKKHWLGLGEEINPSEFTPPDLLNPMEPDRFGVLSVWAEFSVGDFSLELIGSEPTAAIMPWHEENPWRPPRLEGFVIGEVSLPDTPNFIGVFGWEGSGAKASLAYSYGYNTVPEFNLQEPNLLQPEHFRTHLVGLNIYKDTGHFGLKIEAGYRESDSHQDDYIQWLVGADRFFAWERSELYVLLQYVREDVVDEGDNPFQGLDLTRSLKDAITAKFEYKRGGFGIELRGAYDFDKEGHYIQPKLKYNWDNTEVYLGYDSMGGPENSFFGSYGKNDRLFGGVIFHF